MNKQYLKKFIKSVVRENLENHVYKELLKEVSPPGEKAERMIQHVKTSLRKNHPNWDEDKITSVAIATGWKAHNKGSVEEKGKMDEAGLTSEKKDKRQILARKFKERLEESGYKIVSKNSTQVQKDDHARKIQTDPKVNEASYKVVAPRSATDTKEDKARTIQTEPNVNETAYKTQGPSLKTFDQSPQFPDAVNDPENA